MNSLYSFIGGFLGAFATYALGGTVVEVLIACGVMSAYARLICIDVDIDSLRRRFDER